MAEAAAAETCLAGSDEWAAAEAEEAAAAAMELVTAA